jgi:hypothetical protein
MPSLSVSVTVTIIGIVFMILGFALTAKWLKNSDDPISSFELFSVLIVYSDDVQPFVILNLLPVCRKPADIRVKSPITSFGLAKRRIKRKYA